MENHNLPNLHRFCNLPLKAVHEMEMIANYVVVPHRLRKPE